MKALFPILLLASAAPAMAQDITIENFIGTVEIREGSSLSIKGEARGTADLSGASLSIDGGEEIKSLSCNGWNGKMTIGRGWPMRDKRKITDYPTLRITAPTSTALVIRDSLVFGKVSDLADADLQLSSCGELDMGDVTDTLSVRSSGSADVTARHVGQAELMTSGSGDYELLSAESLNFRTSGSGDLAMKDVAGPASISTTGSGDIVLVSIGDGLEFRTTGSGDFLASEINGPVELSSTGSGDVEIDGGVMDSLSARTTGSGDMEIGGKVGPAELSANGSGDIVVKCQSGDLTHRVGGSGDIRVNGKTYERD